MHTYYPVFDRQNIDGSYAIGMAAAFTTPRPLAPVDAALAAERWAKLHGVAILSVSDRQEMAVKRYLEYGEIATRISAAAWVPAIPPPLP